MSDKKENDNRIVIVEVQVENLKPTSMVVRREPLNSYGRITLSQKSAAQLRRLKVEQVGEDVERWKVGDYIIAPADVRSAQLSLYEPDLFVIEDANEDVWASVKYVEVNKGDAKDKPEPEPESDGEPSLIVH